MTKIAFVKKHLLSILSKIIQRLVEKSLGGLPVLIFHIWYQSVAPKEDINLTLLLALFYHYQQLCVLVPLHILVGQKPAYAKAKGQSSTCNQ